MNTAVKRSPTFDSGLLALGVAFTYSTCLLSTKWTREPVKKTFVTHSWFPAILSNSAGEGKIIDLVLIGENPLKLTLTVNPQKKF